MNGGDWYDPDAWQPVEQSADSAAEPDPHDEATSAITGAFLAVADLEGPEAVSALAMAAVERALMAGMSEDETIEQLTTTVRQYMARIRDAREGEAK
ncbi:MAG: hypothetical protein KC503_43455 [Myxococcales bacterium]|nr:hypothetical protein [Myxococcales bacterium]